MTYCTCEEKFCHVNCYGSLCSDIWEKSAIHLLFFCFLNIGRLLIGCVSESNNQKRQKIWLNGFFENTLWRKLFQNCTIFQFLRHYEFCLYLFLRGVNGKGEIGKIMPLTLALMRTQWGSSFTIFFFRENIIV